MIFSTVIGLLIGLQATLHCVGMCGPLALAAPIDRSQKNRAFWGSLTYNFGRITSYTYLGFLLGLLGIGAIWIHAIQVLSVLSGLFFIATAFFGSLETWFIFRQLTAKIGQFNARLFPEIKKMPRALRPYLFGILNGLLPCGMVYLALMYALSSASIAEGALSMFFFGLGTLPVMFFIPLMGQQRFYQVFPRQTQKILLGIIGLLLILRGLNLGIPYLSPSMETPHDHSQPKVECCEVKP
jgi:sulfite exporter TauE/SafE